MKGSLGIYKIMVRVLVMHCHGSERVKNFVSLCEFKVSLVYLVSSSQGSIEKPYHSNKTKTKTKQKTTLPDSELA